MAIVEMRKLGVYGTKKHRKAVLEFLQEMGAVEIDSPDSENVPFEKMDTSSQRIRFQKIADEFDYVIDYLKKYDTGGSGGLLNLENAQITKEEFEEVEKKRRSYYSKVQDVLDLEKSITESKATITRKENKIATISQ